MNALRMLWQVYQGEPLRVRLHVIGRALLCPFAEVMAYVPPTGTIVDVGCGYGILLHLLSNAASNGARQHVGVDHSVAKVEIARRTAKPGITFSHDGLEALPSEQYDAASIVDVLYTIDRRNWREVLAHCHRILKPGGRLIVKEVSDRPRWKAGLTGLEERLAMGVLKLTEGDVPHFESLQTYQRALEEARFRVDEARALKSWHWVSHCLLVASKGE
ncbi:MAG: class I SAM-dependent methyltransferase [Candidatus Omnitrophica bacterium]|nr:class I SAM-dependent methyltransferase [Candidatus Omnitrophota bacterium]